MDAFGHVTLYGKEADWTLAHLYIKGYSGSDKLTGNRVVRARIKGLVTIQGNLHPRRDYDVRKSRMYQLLLKRNNHVTHTMW